MAITLKGRQLLWARSGSRCAICRQTLIPPQRLVIRTPLSEMNSWLERHLGDPGSETSAKGYEDYILLCAEHERVVEGNPNKYPADRLHAIKTRHEDWISRTADENSRYLIGHRGEGRSSDPNIRIPGSELFTSPPPTLDRIEPIIYRGDEWRAYGNLANAIAIVRQWGGLVVSPSDGSYGVNVDPADEEQVTLLRRIVNRPGTSLDQTLMIPFP